MKTVYRAENVIDASIVKDLLDQAGILAFVNGGYLQGGVGELPVSGFVTVSVADEQYPEARQIAEEFDRGRNEQPAAEEMARNAGGGLPDPS